MKNTTLLILLQMILILGFGCSEPLGSNGVTQNSTKQSQNSSGNNSNSGIVGSSDNPLLIGQEPVIANISENYLRGKHYGNCIQQFNASFKVTYAEKLFYPMVSCPGSGDDATPICAQGFQPLTISMVQMNASHSGAVSGAATNDTIQNKLNHFLDADVYWKTTTCVKL